MGGILMLSALLISDSGRLILIYAFAAAMHEAGHLLAAKLLNIGIREIDFGFSGIRIITESRLTSYKRELILASSGPLVNILALFCVLAVFYAKGDGFEDGRMQLRTIDRSRELLLKTAGGLEKENAEKCRLAVGLGAMSGLLLILILL
jgi:hypothetical protein